MVSALSFRLSHKRKSVTKPMILEQKQFNIRQIAESGQCFRMDLVSEARYAVVAFGRYLEIEQLQQEKLRLSCGETEFQTLWKRFFDLEFDYGPIVERLSNGSDEFLREAVSYGSGLRILRQDPFEALISFLISQNKNIPAIKRSIQQICQQYGERIEGTDTSGEKVTFFAFPTPEALAEADPKDIRRAGVGYRDAYIIKTSQLIADGAIDLEALKRLSGMEAIACLKELPGVGDKVANCVALFGLHHLDGCPVDVWIARTVDEVYGGRFDWAQHEGFCGIVQQYMFYYIRSKYGK